MRARSTLTLWLAVLFAAGCSKVGIDTASIASVSNDDTYAMLDFVWSGVRATITSKKEPLTSPFNLALSYSLDCPSSGQRSYQGTLVGTNTSGTGSATLSLTATLTQCAFDDRITIRTITASGVVVTGTIAIANDTYAATNLHMTASSVTVNGTMCTGGIDVIIVGTSPASQPTASGSACGRSGVVPLP